MTRRRALVSLVLALGGGVFVVTAVAFARVALRRRNTPAIPAAPLAAAEPPPAPSVDGSEWVQMPPGSTPPVGPPPVTPAEHVVPHARDAEEVVERLVPQSRRRSRWRRFLDPLLAVVILAVAAVAVVALVRVA